MMAAKSGSQETVLLMFYRKQEGVLTEPTLILLASVNTLLK